MIDTIVLTLNPDMYQIIEPDRFVPSARWILYGDKTISHGIRSKQNPTKKELLQGIYKPRLTLSLRVSPLGHTEAMLKIELSLPKLVFGNNFEELRYKDFEALNQKLVSTLKIMGVIVSPTILASTPVSAIHYSKNIPLIDGSIPYHYINKIKEANVQQSLDTNQTDYRNEGHSFKWHCNSYEIVFYDKIKDLEKAKVSSKRSLEKDGILQLKLIDLFKKRKRFEVLRMEVRLNKRQKLKHLFKKLNIKADLTFKKLFKPAIAKKVLLHYLDELESKRSALLDYKATNDKALLAALIVNNPELSPRRLLTLYGLRKALDVTTARELQVMLNNKQIPSKLLADTNTLTLPGIQRPFKAIHQGLIKFKPLKLS